MGFNVHKEKVRMLFLKLPLGITGAMLKDKDGDVRVGLGWRIKVTTESSESLVWTKQR